MNGKKLLTVLLAALLALAPLAGLAETSCFDHLPDAMDYVLACAGRRETEMTLSLTGDACSTWDTDDLRSAFGDQLGMCDTYRVNIERYDDLAADVRIKCTYRDAVRMADAYQSGDVGELSEEEQSCLDQAVEIVRELQAQYSGLELERAIYDTICLNMRYQTYEDKQSDAFRRIATVCSALSDGVGNCQAYASAFYLLGTLAGFDVGFLSGWYEDYSEGQHLWNTISIDGATLMVDVTDGDLNVTDSGNQLVKHRCFNAGVDRISNINSWSLHGLNPVEPWIKISATVPEYSYYNNRDGWGGCFSDLNEAAEYCVRVAESGRGTCELLLLDSTPSTDEFNAALESAASGRTTRWHFYHWYDDCNNTCILLIWEQF